MTSKLGEGYEMADIEKAVNTQHAEPLYMNGELVGCVKRAHEHDKNLTSHIMTENLVVKASGILAGLHLIDKYVNKPRMISII